jgi:hypothetical protein
VHQARDEPLQQLALAEDDDGLVADAGREVAAALDRLAGADEARQEERAPGEQSAGGAE